MKKVEKVEIYCIVLTVEPTTLPSLAVGEPVT
jgi:hypothetical protein